MTQCNHDGHDGCSAPDQDRLALEARMSRIGRKFLVLSGKGGVGKSTVAVNLAMSLAASGRKVGLLDVDLHGPSVPRMTGLEGQRLGVDETGAIEPLWLSRNLAVVSVGLLLDSTSDAVVWRGPMKYSVIQRLLKDVGWGNLDCLVIDSPPGTGDEPLSVAQLVGDNACAVLVTTPQEVSVTDVRRSVSFCRMLNLPIAGIIENMGSMICPHCGQSVEIFGSGGGSRLADEMGVDLLGCIPLDPRVVAGADRGAFLAESCADSPVAAAFAGIVAKLDSPAAPGQAVPSKNSESSTLEIKEQGVMTIAIPTAEGRLCMHFGHCQQFAMVEVADDGRTIVGVNYLTPPPHEPGLLPRWLGEQGATMIIAGGMGRRAQDLFAAGGIEVVVGAPAEEPAKVAADYLSGALATGENTCDH